MALRPVCRYCGLHGQNPQASFRLSPAKIVLAALVVEIDTIPKPRGLGEGERNLSDEHKSNKVER